MLNVTLYVPGVSPGTVCGVFHDCPVRPSISTVAPIGNEETINWPSVGAGGATGATTDVLRAALLARVEGACVVAGLSLSWLNGAGPTAAGTQPAGLLAAPGTGGGLVLSAGMSAGSRW